MNVIHLKQSEFPLPEGLSTDAACEQTVPRARFAFVEAPDKLTVFEPFTARVCDQCLYICIARGVRDKATIYTYGLLPGQDSIPLPHPEQEETRELCHVS